MFKLGNEQSFLLRVKDLDRDLKFMYLKYQDKPIRTVPTGAATIQNFHRSQKYAIGPNLLRGDVTTNILSTDDNKKVIFIHTKN